MWITKKTSQIRRVDCITDAPVSLLSFSDTIRTKLEIKYSGEQASSVFLYNLEVFNSGNQAVTTQPCLIRLDDKAKIIGYSIKTQPAVGFGEITKLQPSLNSLDLSIQLLNPGDRVYLELISVNNASEKIDVYMKNANVICRSYTRQAAESAILGTLSKAVDPGLMFLGIIRSLPFFGGIAEPLMMILLTERFEKALRQRK
jgi:hypothetical protein